MDKLNDCKRCGSKIIVKNWINRGVWFEREKNSWGYCVVCGKCSNKGDTRDNPTDAVKSWNEHNEMFGSIFVGVFVYFFLLLLLLLVLFFIG